MRIGVASARAFSIAIAIAGGSVFLTAPFLPAEANPKPRTVVVGGAPAAAVPRMAPPSAPAPAAAPAAEQKVASAEGQEKSNDPLANLNVSARTKAHQERADRILAENGESRKDETDADGAFSGEPAPKPLQPSKAKELAAGIRCIAGCD